MGRSNAVIYEKNVIINFLKEKKVLIDKYLGRDSEYVTEVDFNEIMNWPLDYCSKVIESLGGSLSFLDSDPDICPWCILFNNERHRCIGCQYGMSYGNCKYDKDSKYFKTVYDLRIKLIRDNISKIYSPISRVPGMWELVLKYNKICSDLLPSLEE